MYFLQIGKGQLRDLSFVSMLQYKVLLTVGFPWAGMFRPSRLVFHGLGEALQCLQHFLGLAVVLCQPDEVELECDGEILNQKTILCSYINLWH